MVPQVLVSGCVLAQLPPINFFFSGRTTFVNTLCGKKVLQGKDADDATNAHLEEGVRIKPITVGAQHLRSRMNIQVLMRSRVGIG